MKKTLLRGATVMFVLTASTWLYGCGTCCSLCCGGGIPTGLTSLTRDPHPAPDEAPAPTVAVRADGVAY